MRKMAAFTRACALWLCLHVLPALTKAAEVESGPCCLPDISVGFVWPIAPVGTTVQRICDNIHSNFHPLTYARRTCLSGAVWGPVDVSGCTVLNHNTATIAIVVVANITASRLAVEANLSALVDQITSALSEYSPQGFALNRWNSELNDTRTRVVIRGQLPLSTDSSVLSIFADNGPPPGMFTFAGTPEIYGFIPSGTCNCGTMGDRDHNFQGLCLSPIGGSLSLSSCKCYMEQCSCQFPFTAVEAQNYTACTIKTLMPEVIQNCAASPVGGCNADSTSYYTLSHSWSTAAACTVVRQPCSASNIYLGIVRRICNSIGQWEEPDVSECQDFKYSIREIQRESLELQMSIAKNPVVLAGGRLDIISSGCNGYYFTRLEDLTSRLPSSLSASQQLLPKEASIVAHFLHSASQIAKCTNLFQYPNYMQELVSILQDFLISSRTNVESWNIWTKTLTGTEELSYLAGAIQLIIFELSANLGTLTNAILDGDGVYRWTSTAQEQLGIEAELLPNSFNGTRVFLESVSQLLGKVAVSVVSNGQNSTGVPVSAAYSQAVFSQRLPKTFLNQSSIGFAVVHPVVVFVSAGNTERFTADVQFELESSSTYVRGQCVQWVSAAGNLSGGWSDSNVTTNHTASGSICTSSQPGMYGLFQVIPLELQASPPSATVYPGNTVTLQCSPRLVPSHEGEFSVTWKHSGSPLNEILAGKQYRVLSTGMVSSLTLFTSLELNTAGTYTCEAQGSPSSTVSIDVDITLHSVSMLNMSMCSEDAFSATGGEVCIRCTTIGRTDNPVPTEVIWKLNGSDILSYPSGTFVYTSGAAVENMLVVVTPTPEFSGLYSCAVRESPAVVVNRAITVYPGCASTAFAQASPVGARYQSGCYTWFCVGDQQWVGDYSECVSEMATDVVHLSFLVRGDVPTVNSRFTTITADVVQAIRGILAIVDPVPASSATVAASGTYNMTLVSYALQVNSSVATDISLHVLEEVFVGSLTLGGLEAMLSTARSIAILDRDVCECPLLLHLQQTEQYQPIPRVHLCRQTQYSPLACNCTPASGCACTDEFTKLEEPDRTPQCSLDTDRDGVPDHQDPCLGCCAPDLSGGFLWQRTPEGIEARVSCGMLHPTLNNGSHIKRTCSTDGMWSGVRVQSCTFSSTANSTLVVLVFHVGAEEEQLRMFEEESKRFLSTVSLTTPSQVTVLYNSLSDGEGNGLSITSVTAVVELPSITRQEAEELVLNTFSGIEDIAGSLVVQSSMVYILKPASNCTCNGLAVLSDSEPLFLELCKGPSLPSCSCTSGECQCSDPFVELSPSVATPGSVVCNYNGAEYSSMVVPQRGCTPTPGARGCVGEPAIFPHLPWSPIPPCHSEERRCAEDPNNALGTATRFCNSNGMWEDPDLTQCETATFRDIRMTTEQILSAIQNDPMYQAGRIVILQEELVTMLTETTNTLVSETTGQDQEGLLPKDLNTTVTILHAMASISEGSDLLNQTSFNRTTLFLIASNALEDRQLLSWGNLSKDANFSASATLLRSTERLSLALARNINKTEEGMLTFANIDVQAMQIDASVSEGLVMPVGISSPGVSLPMDLITERRQGSGMQVPVAITVLRNMSQYLPNSFRNQTSLPDGVSPSALILSAQVGNTQGFSPALEQNPANITFNLVMCQEESPSCVFYDFNSTSSGESGWSMEGVTTMQTNASEVVCTSNHLTSFAILVSTQQVTPNTVALSIASYVGCALSFVCLTLSIIFFLSMGKNLVDSDRNKNYVNFVHLNLCIALASGLLIFMAGIQGGTGSAIGCTIVSVLLHYFFLVAFSWMLCEAVVLYNLLIKVFPTYISGRRWLLIYSSIGWGFPLPVVLISLIAVLAQPNQKYYRQYSTQQDPTTCSISMYTACWLPVERGVVAAFLVPMAIILLINTVLLVIVLRSLWHHWRRQHSITKSEQSSRAANRSIGIKLVKAILFLMPLMGLTWIIGLFAVDQNTAVFAWLFLLLNSLQGVFFFIFYVLRHDRVRPKLNKALAAVRKWCWQKCFVCHRELESELVASPSTEEPRPLQQEDEDAHTSEHGVQSSIRRLTRRMLTFFHREHVQETGITSGTSTLPHASQAQLNSSTAGNTTFIAAVEQDAQQSSNQEPRSTNTLQLVPLPHSPVDSSTEEDSSLFRIIDVLWEEEV